MGGNNQTPNCPRASLWSSFMPRHDSHGTLAVRLHATPLALLDIQTAPASQHPTRFQKTAYSQQSTGGTAHLRTAPNTALPIKEADMQAKCLPAEVPSDRIRTRSNCDSSLNSHEKMVECCMADSASTCDHLSVGAPPCGGGGGATRPPAAGCWVGGGGGGGGTRCADAPPMVGGGGGIAAFSSLMRLALSRPPPLPFCEPACAWLP